MRHFYRFLAISIILFGISSCSNSYDNPTPAPNLITFKATLTGPVTKSSVADEAILIYNDDTNTFTITVTHNVADANAAHIHTTDPVIPPATNNIVFPLASTVATAVSPIIKSGTLDTNQEAALKAEKYYVNIHNPAYPGPTTAALSGVLRKQGSTGGGGGGY